MPNTISADLPHPESTSSRLIPTAKGREPIPFAARLSATIQEACEATGIGRTKLYQEMQAGRVETMKLGKRRLVLVRSLLALIDPKAVAGVAA